MQLKILTCLMQSETKHFFTSIRLFAGEKSKRGGGTEVMYCYLKFKYNLGRRLLKMIR